MYNLEQMLNIQKGRIDRINEILKEIRHDLIRMKKETDKGVENE